MPPPISFLPPMTIDFIQILAAYEVNKHMVS